MRPSGRTHADTDGLGNLRVAWLFEGPSLRISRYACVAPLAGPGEEQRQPGHVVAFPLKGSFLLRGGCGTRLIDPNCALLLNRGAPYTSSHPAGGGDEGVGIVVEEAQLLDAVRELDPRGADAASGPFRRAWVPSAPGTCLRLRGLLQALRSGTSDAAGIEERAFGLVGEALASLSGGRDAAPGRDARVRERVEAARAILNARFAEKLRLGELAAALGTSPFHLCRAFRRETGLPIHRYLNRLRLRAALEGVEDGRPDLAGVALRAGFSSHSHFSAAFRREFGVAPRELRRAVSKILTARSAPGA